MKTETLHSNYDVCIHGNDLRAFNLAVEKVRAGLHTVLVYQGESGRNDFSMHHDLILQALQASASCAHGFRTAEKYGLLNAIPETGWHSVKIHIKDALERIAPHYSFEKLRAIGVEILHPPLQDEIIRAKETIHLPLPVEPAGFSSTSTLKLGEILDWKTQPEHLLIVGAGARALELAQSLSRLGTKTTIIHTGMLLPGLDPELFKILYDRFEYEGIRIIQNSEITDVEQSGEKSVLHMMHEGTKRRVTGSHILLMPEEEQPQNSALTDPALAWAGLHEFEAREKLGAGNFHLVKWRYQESDFAQTQRKTEGLLKITAKPDGTLLGVHICGDAAQEIIAFWSLALSQNMKLQDMRAIELPYGSYAHMSLRAIEGYLAQIKNPSRQFKPGSFWQGLIGT